MGRAIGADQLAFHAKGSRLQGDKVNVAEIRAADRLAKHAGINLAGMGEGKVNRFGDEEKVAAVVPVVENIASYLPGLGSRRRFYFVCRDLQLYSVISGANSDNGLRRPETCLPGLDLPGTLGYTLITFEAATSTRTNWGKHGVDSTCLSRSLLELRN